MQRHEWCRMGKRLRRQQLFAEIEEQRTALDQCLALVPARLMTKAGVTHGGWSVKDILSHLVEWQQMNLNWYACGPTRREARNSCPRIYVAGPPALESDDLSKAPPSTPPVRSGGLRLVPRAHPSSHRDPLRYGLGDVGALLLDRTILDTERLFAGQYVGPLSLGTYSDQALVASTTDGEELAFQVAW